MIVSLRCVQLIAGVLGRAGESGQKKRLEAAEKGTVTWETPQIVEQWMSEQKELDARLETERKIAEKGNDEDGEKIARTKEELLKL